MYEWRNMTAEERRKLLAWRKEHSLPWHSPRHEDQGDSAYHMSAACYEHKPIIGTSFARMEECETVLLDTIRPFTPEIFAWCVLPNHYHLLFRTERINALIAALGRFHGRSSHTWNGLDKRRGRKVWCNCVDRAMRSERHLWASMNYVHHNAVHHGYVTQWQDWPFSSADTFLEQTGREEAARIWSAYPILDYGKGWDDPDL